MIEVVAAIIRRDGKILITQRPDDVHLARLWEFPGGKVEPEETLEAALEREILEELGTKIRVDDEFFLVEHHYPERSVRLHFFNCALIEGEPASIEVQDLRWVEAAELDSFAFPAADASLIDRLRIEG